MVFTIHWPVNFCITFEWALLHCTFLDLSRTFLHQIQIQLSLPFLNPEALTMSTSKRVKVYSADFENEHKKKVLAEYFRIKDITYCNDLHGPARINKIRKTPNLANVRRESKKSVRWALRHPEITAKNFDDKHMRAIMTTPGLGDKIIEFTGAAPFLEMEIFDMYLTKKSMKKIFSLQRDYVIGCMLQSRWVAGTYYHITCAHGDCECLFDECVLKRSVDAVPSEKEKFLCAQEMKTQDYTHLIRCRIFTNYDPRNWRYHKRWSYYDMKFGKNFVGKHFQMEDKRFQWNHVSHCLS
jgi:hypothetical protein